MSFAPTVISTRSTFTPFAWIGASAAITLAACGTPDTGAPDAAVDAAPTGVALLGAGTHAVPAARVRVISTATDALNGPTDLAFHPDYPDQLWVTNRTDHSIVMFHQTGASGQTSEKWGGNDDDGMHFLAKPSGLAFGAPGFFATSPDENQITQPSTPGAFMGPVLWSSDPMTFNGGMSSHYGMLHNSPLSAGIAWDHDNVYWLFDGTHRSLTRYDFHAGHPIGGADHTNGEIARFVAGQVGYVAGVASHMKLDHTSGLLYVADSGNDRIAVLDTASGTRGASLPANYDSDVQYEMTGATITTLVDGASMGLMRPSGLSLNGSTLFVTDNGTSRVYAFDLHGRLLDWLDLSAQVTAGGLMGLTFDGAGNLFVVDHAGNQVVEVTAPGA